MDLYLIKDGNEKIIEISDDMMKDIKDPNCPLFDKYINKDDYSLVIHNDKEKAIFTCINKNITKDSYSKLANTTRRIYNENKVFDYTCYNYLENDYEAINVFDKYEMDAAFSTFCEEKVGNSSFYIKNILNDFRTFNLKKCLLNNYKKQFPNNKNCGVILISNDKRADIPLTKRDHFEVIGEYTKNNNWDLKNENTIVVIVSTFTLFIELPDSINDFQKEQLRKINEEVSDIRNISMPVYVDVLKDGIIYKDISDALDVKVKEKK